MAQQKLQKADGDKTGRETALSCSPLRDDASEVMPGKMKTLLKAEAPIGDPGRRKQLGGAVWLSGGNT